MIHSKQGWLLFPFRFFIAIGVAYLISSGLNQSKTTQLDLAFLASNDKPQAVSREVKKVELPESDTPSFSLSSKIGLSASVALVLYIWIAYEWVGFARFTNACKRLKKLGAKIRFEYDSDKAFYQYYFRAETAVDLSRQQLREEHFKLLGQLPNVTNLLLGHAKVPSNLTKCLSGIKKLRKIDVQGVSLNDAQRSELAKLLIR